MCLCAKQHARLVYVSPINLHSPTREVCSPSLLWGNCWGCKSAASRPERWFPPAQRLGGKERACLSPDSSAREKRQWEALCKWHPFFLQTERVKCFVCLEELFYLETDCLLHSVSHLSVLVRKMASCSQLSYSHQRTVVRIASMVWKSTFSMLLFCLSLCYKL